MFFPTLRGIKVEDRVYPRATFSASSKTLAGPMNPITYRVIIPRASGDAVNRPASLAKCGFPVSSVTLSMKLSTCLWVNQWFSSWTW